MKLKSTFALLIALCLFSACETETISGEMIYYKSYVKTAESSVISSDTPCAALLAAVQQGVNDRVKTYNKEWRVPFSGPSVDDALAAADAQAVADFDAAVASLQNWKKSVDETIASKDFGKGSFSLTYVVRVWRDKVLKESAPIVFEYRYQK